MGRQFYDTVSALTEEQKQIALFWADNPVATGTPGFHWISVVNLMGGRRKLSADAAVELYTLTSLAIADAFIGCWQEKYRSNVVRPVAWVRRVLDPKYQTVIPTPPFPEYTSGHSVQSRRRSAGDDHASSATPSRTATRRRWTSASRRAGSHPSRRPRDEVAISRVYAGVHILPGSGGRDDAGGVHRTQGQRPQDPSHVVRERARTAGLLRHVAGVSALLLAWSRLQ